MASSNPPLVPVYRYYLNSNPAQRFYMASPGPGNFPGLTLEGPKFRVFMEPADGTVPVYVFIQGDNYYYTLDQNDPAAEGLGFPRIAWYAFDLGSGSVPQNSVPLWHYTLNGSDPSIDFYTPDPEVESLGQYTKIGFTGFVYPMIISGGSYIGKVKFRPMLPFASGAYEHGVILRDQMGEYLFFLVTQIDPNPQIINDATPETYIVYSNTADFSLTSSNIYLATSDGLPINLIPAPPLPNIPPDEEEGMNFFTTTTGSYALLTAQLCDSGGGTAEGSFYLYTAGQLVRSLMIPGLGASILGTLSSGSSIGSPSEIQFLQTEFAPALQVIQSQGSYLNGDLSFLDLSGAQLSNINFSGTSFQCTKLAGAVLGGVNFTSCDLTSIFFDSKTALSYTQSQPMIFNGATVPYELIGKNWQWFDLTGATIPNLAYWLAADDQPLQAAGAKLSHLNQNDFRKLTLVKAVFSNAVLDKLDLDGAVLTGAKFIDASLHSTNLSNATLVGAKMNGAQLGTLAQLFTLPSSTESALNSGEVATLSQYFSENGITLSSTASLETIAANRVWQLNDAGNHILYTIRLETQNDSTQVLTVYSPALAASLVNAYMPNAVLTGANLYGVQASGAQFYGSTALIDGSAILEGVQFDDANLSNLNLTQAQMFGADLSGAQLFNAKFNGANLTPSADGTAANLSNANLQGADFTDARLYGANLTNAAVAINIPTPAVPQQGGVYLFTLPYAGDANAVQQYITELNNNANTQFSLNPDGDAPTLQKYVTALETNNLALLKVAFREQQPPITLSNNAQIETISSGSVWQIVDEPTSYTLWTEIDENGNTELYAAPSLTLTQAAFQHFNMTLRWQASVSVLTSNSQWWMDNDSENPENFSTGYVSFILQLNDGALDVYGTAIRIERLGDNNQLELDTETCNVTALTVSNMDGDTICPNGATLSVNQLEGGVDWDVRWLRAATPPAPPPCVPSDYSFCPQAELSKGSQKSS